jgi:hypothetical protein
LAFGGLTIAKRLKIRLNNLAKPEKSALLVRDNCVTAVFYSNNVSVNQAGWWDSRFGCRDTCIVSFKVVDQQPLRSVSRRHKKSTCEQVLKSSPRNVVR